VEGVGVTGKQSPEITNPFRLIRGLELSIHID
jgi:hypothetical protein